MQLTFQNQVTAMFKKSSVTIDNFRKLFVNFRMAIVQIWKILRSSSESGRKSSENCQKRRY